MKRRNSSFEEGYVWDILYQTVLGLKTLHDMKILHRDLKCANIFLGSNNMVKLGDMNVSKVNKRGLAVT